MIGCVRGENETVQQNDYYVNHYYLYIFIYITAQKW